MKRKSLLLTIALSLCLTVVLGFGSSALAAQNKIDVIYDGSPIIFDVQPQSLNGRTMVPFRQIFETLGYDVDWNEATKTVTAKSKEGGDTITLTIDNVNITMNGKTVKSDVPPISKNNRTLVPVRIVSELSGKDVLWDDYGPAVMIYSKLAEDYMPVQQANQTIVADSENVYTADYKDGEQHFVQINHKTNQKTFKLMNIRSIQPLGDSLHIEGEDNLYIYQPKDGSMQTYKMQPESRLCNTYFYDNEFYGNQCYLPPGREEYALSGYFAKMLPADEKVNLLNLKNEVFNSYIIYNDHIFSDGTVQDLKTAESKKLFPVDSPYYSLRFYSDAVCGDYYYYSTYVGEGYNQYETKTLLKYNYKTGELQKLPYPQGKIIANIVVTDNSIFYVLIPDNFLGDTKIYRATVNGTNAVPIANTNTEYSNGEMALVGNQIFYPDYHNNNIFIKAVNTDGSNRRILYQYE